MSWLTCSSHVCMYVCRSNVNRKSFFTICGLLLDDSLSHYLSLGSKRLKKISHFYCSPVIIWFLRQLGSINRLPSNDDCLRHFQESFISFVFPPLFVALTLNVQKQTNFPRCDGGEQGHSRSSSHCFQNCELFGIEGTKFKNFFLIRKVFFKILHQKDSCFLRFSR